MKFHITDIKKNNILVMARVEGEKGLVGDLIEDIHRGGSFGIISFDRLVELGLGEHDYDEESKALEKK